MYEAVRGSVERPLFRADLTLDSDETHTRSLRLRLRRRRRGRDLRAGRGSLLFRRSGIGHIFVASIACQQLGVLRVSRTISPAQSRAGKGAPIWACAVGRRTEYNTGYSVSPEVSARPRVGSPDGRRPEGDPTRGRAGTEGDAEYTVLYFIYVIPTQENTPFNAR
ncbi:hypothetical protein Bbelb_105610 [Branchiostoma belcheri]|nr:hypothetical protein Bbelb_105610 [Branchiostoma belcheri]